MKLGLAGMLVAGCGNVASNTDAAVSSHDAPRAIDAAAPDGTAKPCDLTKPFGQPTALMEFNTSAADAYVTLSSDELTAYVSTGGGPSPQGSYDLYIATRTSIGAMFGALSPMTALNSAASQGASSVTADGLNIFYFDSSVGGGDLFTASRTSVAGSFGAGSAATGINAPNAFDNCPYLLGDGLTMYFASNRAGANYDLYKTTRASLTSAFTTPVPVTELNTTAYTEADETLTPDGLTMFFGGDGPGTAGSEDIWMTTRASTSAAFGTPVNIGELNTAVADWPTYISADGCRLYFGSDRGGGQGGHDLYVATRPK